MQARNNNIVYALSAVAFLILFNIIDRAPIFHSPIFVNSCARVVFVFSIATQFSFKKKASNAKSMDDFFKADATPASTPPPQQPDQNQSNDFFAAGTFVCAFKHAHRTSFLFSNNSLPSYSSIFVFNHLRTCPLSIAQAKRTDLFPHHHPLPRMPKCNRYRATKILLEKT